jgi:hypothetical protein
MKSSNIAVNLQKVVRCAILIACISVPLSAQQPTGESRFIREFGLSTKLGGLTALFSSAGGDKIDKIAAGGTESKTEISGRVFITRRWDVEIGQFVEPFSAFDFEKGISQIIQSRLKKEGFKFKPVSMRIYGLDYSRGTTVGSIDLRTYFDEKSEYHMCFVFHESFVKKRKRLHPIPIPMLRQR